MKSCYTQPTSNSVNNQKGFFPIILGVLVLLFAIGGGAYYLSTQNGRTTPQSQNNIQPTANPQNTTAIPATILPMQAFSDTETANWKTYTNSKNAYSFKYPADWELGIVQTTDGRAIDTVSLLLPIRFSIVENGNTYPGPYVISTSFATKSEFETFQKQYPYAKEIVNGYDAYRFKAIPSQFEVEYVYMKRNDGNYIATRLTPYSKSQRYPNQDEPYRLYNLFLRTLNPNQ